MLLSQSLQSKETDQSCPWPCAVYVGSHKGFLQFGKLASIEEPSLQAETSVIASVEKVDI